MSRQPTSGRGSGSGTTSSRALSPREQRDRRRSRAWALQVHYAWESGAEDRTLVDALVETAGTRLIAPRRLDFIRRILSLLDAHGEEIDRVLDEALDHWRLERLAAVDRAVLRIGAAELLFAPDVPPKTAILEAVRLAEAYGGPESPRFVNGVLDALFKRVRPED